VFGVWNCIYYFEFFYELKIAAGDIVVGTITVGFVYLLGNIFLCIYSVLHELSKFCRGNMGR